MPHSRTAPILAQGAVRDIRQGALRRTLHGRRVLPRGRERPADAALIRGHRPLPGKGGRQEQLPDIHRRYGQDGKGARGARGRSQVRHRQKRVRASFPAASGPGDRPRLLPRGPRALGQAGDRARPARQVHPRRGGHPPDNPPWRMGPQGGVPELRGLGRRCPGSPRRGSFSRRTWRGRSNRPSRMQVSRRTGWSSR